MNATDILGELIRGGGGGGLLKDILTGGAKPKPSPRTSKVPSSPSGPVDYEQQIRELEESLGVGKGGPPASPPTPGKPTNWTPPPIESVPPPLPKRSGDQRPDPEQEDAESLILIRAMVNATMADGRLSREEQDRILKKLGDRSPDAVRFLQNEFKKLQSPREFTWSVPLGMEYKVYTVSLSAIDLDRKSESDYLAELAHGLRLPLEVRQHIHQRYGAPLPS